MIVMTYLTLMIIIINQFSHFVLNFSLLFCIQNYVDDDDDKILTPLITVPFYKCYMNYNILFVCVCVCHKTKI